MKFLRGTWIGALGLVIVLVLIVYAVIYQPGVNAKYGGLVTVKPIDLDEATVAYFKGRLATTQAAIAAHEAAGEKVDLDLYLSAASDAYAVGQLITAREMLEKQLAGNSIYPVAWNNYAHVLEDMQDWEMAEDAYQKAIDLDSDLNKFWSDYADFLSDHFPDRTSDLKEVYESSVDVVGQQVWNMLGLAKLYAAEGDCDRAEDRYQVAIALSPDNQAIKDDLAALKHSCVSSSN